MTIKTPEEIAVEVYGREPGEGWDCITDYTVDAQEALAETEAWIETNDPDRRR